MIVKAFIDVLAGLLNFIVAIIPSFDFGFSIAGYIEPLVEVMYLFNLFISLPAVMLCISAVLVVDNFTFFIKVFGWIWDKIPLT